MRIVAISDTHSLHEKMKHPVPDGDVLVHCGDFCGRHYLEWVEEFAAWFASFPHPRKVAIAGNHDRAFEFAAPEAEHIFSALGITYLRDSGVEIAGKLFWGSPWTPAFFNWSFMYERGPEAASQWKTLPDDVDILITHGPPKGILDACPEYPRPRDRTPKMVHVGCGALRDAVVERVRPKAHLFGHIHEGSGEEVVDGIRFVNASICTGAYVPVNPPRVVDV